MVIACFTLDPGVAASGGRALVLAHEAAPRL
jgi:hypothetical protein